MDYQHYNTFNLYDPKTGKTKNSLDDYGGIIINTNEEYYERECMPQFNFTTDKNDTRDGEIFIRATRSPRNLDNLEMFFTEENGGGDLDELKKWLGKPYQQWFSWDGDDRDVGIWAIIDGGFKSQVYYGKKFFGKIPLKFIAHDPYYYKTRENDIVFPNLPVGSSKNIGYLGNTNGYPVIKITATTTTVKFKWNDLVVNLNSLTTNPIYLDCKKCQCYEMVNGIKVLTSSKYYSTKYIDFPELECDLPNSLNILEGNIVEFRITPNTRFI